MLEAFCLPLIDAALKDQKLFDRLSLQFERVIGERKIGQLAYKTVARKRPDLLRRRIVDRVIRRNLGV